ncbi:MAG: FAD-binding oxidoreductase [Cyclobacteriaceae bacterium]|nr:FAD-binding oxidoreductase [Cyclobacteriaceae bacterium]UYN85826.1 MAG: FAD-binding oxidoreductase [Cyclobacteriaceae bacterium]
MTSDFITNWNNYPLAKSKVSSPVFAGDFSAQLADTSPFIVRGNGRCYGDASLAPSITSTLKFNRIINFDESKGIITCQSGLLLSDILDVIMPRGWFLPVTPGTRFITVGGAVASDVHGKNHHKDGSFSQHVISLKILTPKGEIISCNASENSEYFWFTCGGMGLTGIILEVTFSLKRIETGYIRQVQIKSGGLDEVLDLFEQYSHYTYSVAWIDCLKTGANFGRSILMLGEHASVPELKSARHAFPKKSKTLSVPFNFPSFVLNGLSVKAFNSFFYAKNYKKEMHSMATCESFFYPLDAILHWNRIYGKRGFVQYQFVIPKERGKEGVRNILNRISSKGWGSFLAVLKLFGTQQGPISFNMEGYTLALDIPINDRLFSFLDELDLMVKDYGGRIYLTKDARMKAEIFHSTYPHASNFVSFLRKIDPERKIVSSLSRRLEIK